MERKDVLPFVTVVIPVLNEEDFILPLLESLGCLDGKRCLPGQHEILVVDGGSTDRTLDILAGLSCEAGLRVIDNPARIQSAGVNLAARQADPRARYLVRIDAHSVYDPGYVRRVVDTLVETGAQSVVVPLISRPRETAGRFAKAVAMAQRSKLGNGGSAHRLETTPAQWVDHGHHAGFDLAFFRSLGGYDETFITNEDAEYDVRVAMAGGRIWFEPRAKVWYSSRGTPKTLARQYYRYGIGRASTILKHRLMPRPRQMLPVAASLANVTGFLGGFLYPLFWLIPVVYLIACYAIIRKEQYGGAPSQRAYAIESASVVIMHTSWAMGFLRRLIVR